jgi:hypothetical protein
MKKYKIIQSYMDSPHKWTVGDIITELELNIILENNPWRHHDILRSTFLISNEIFVDWLTLYQGSPVYTDWYMIIAGQEDWEFIDKYGMIGELDP